MKKPENEEELTDRAANTNNEWMTALFVLIAELSYMKISASIQHHRSDVRQLRHYLMTN